MADEMSVTFPRQGSDYVPLPRGHKNGSIQAHAVQTINAEPEHVYGVYSKLELLPTWQDGVVQVTATSDTMSHWVMQDLGTGEQVEFDSEIVEAVPGVRHISRVVNGPFEGTTDTVTFAAHPAGRGTTVTWVSEFHLPGGVVGNAIAAVASRTPEQMLIENLRHLKQLIETNEIPSVEGQPAGPRGVMGKWKQFLMGENLPIPPGTSDRARPRDLPQHASSDMPLKVAGVAIVAGAFAWYGIRRLIGS
jgi:uncharacterized membrane protein